jgi:hypothetical protein
MIEPKIVPVIAIKSVTPAPRRNIGQFSVIIFIIHSEVIFFLLEKNNIGIPVQLLIYMYSKTPKNQRFWNKYKLRFIMESL